ncbi:MAG: transcription-repair coupling factor, partial [Bacteriovoracaceae bacterium]
QELLEKFDNHSFFPNFPLFFPLLFKESSTLFTELKDASLFHFFNFEEAQKSFALMLEEYNEAYDLSQSDQDSQELLPSPKLLYSERDPEELDSLHINDVHFGASFEQDYQNSVAIGVEPIKTYISRNHIVSTKHNKQEFIQSLIKTILNEKREKNIWIVYKNDSALKQIKNVLEPFLKAPLPNIRFLHFDLTEGFIYKNENLFFVGESDFFIHKSQKTKKRANRNNDVFAEQLSSLIAGDYVIHKEHGVGRYAGIETIELGKQKGDFIVLEYADNDKVYVPVYKLDLVQKHSNSQSNVKLANLKSKKFDLEKARASKSVKKLAFDLLELQAKRELKKGFQFSPPDELFRDFEQKFPFQETEDQIKAIEDVIEDMTNPRPMDRLICGDVGFGKTEIAMRAAFKAVLDHKQTAILVPTTVLAFQHYNTMTERFKDFAVNIEFVSRFKSAKQTSDIFQRLREGKIDILIGTHKILSEKAVFHDLGLLIVDEEQRFGVGHKEKLKSLKENIDCLTMTATPIPRTLQMSFLGIKDLSLIQTAPPKRRSIKTYLIKEDPSTIQKAIQKELKRGGQVFIVHNKVKDIEEYTHKIKQLAPEAKTIFAHGQMPEKELEKRITSFYEHKQDVLVSTTIIESGIDIPSANTMIIDRADTYGLSQLHQLRGRIGRSDKKAYAYFVIPHNRTLSAVAVKRLKALQTYAEMGAGFSLATSDLEIRGSGDILGGEQSGHIANIGLELYMELLQEAIAELKHEKTERKKPVEIQTPFHAVIPNDYISDTGLRLKYYKRLSNASTLESLQLIIDEMNDIYGLSPQSAANLFVILESRIHFAKALASSIKVNSKQIIISFDQQEVEQNVQARNKIIDFFMQRPKVYKLNADFSANCRFKDSVSPDTLLEFSKYIAQQTDPC